MMNKEPLIWVCVMVLIAVGFSWLAIHAVRWAKKGSKAGSMLAAAAFPYPDQPPPQEQVEQQNRLKKEAESGDPDDLNDPTDRALEMRRKVSSHADDMKN